MADENEQSYPDVYVFFPQAAPDIVQQVQRTSGEGGPVRFVASVTGSFDAIAVVEVEPDREKESPLAALPSTIAKYFGGNVKGDPPKAVPLINGPLWLRHTRQYPQLAFVGIRVQPGRARPQSPAAWCRPSSAAWPARPRRGRAAARASSRARGLRGS